MTLASTRAPVSGVDYSAESYRLALQAMFGPTLATFSGGVSGVDPSHGVTHPDAYQVTQNGTPNMSVNVAAGLAVIRGTESALQGCYPAANDGTVNVTIAAADASNPRKDIVGLRVYDSNYGSSDPVDDGVFIEVITGTPAASPADPTLPDNFLPLARVTVAASDTSITTGEITDLRRIARPWSLPRGEVGYDELTSDQSIPTSTGAIPGMSVTFTSEADRRYQLIVSMGVSTAGNSQTLQFDVYSNTAAAQVCTMPAQILQTVDLQAYHYSKIVNSPAAGSTTWIVRGLASASGALVEGGSAAATIQVIDIGPA